MCYWLASRMWRPMCGVSLKSAFRGRMEVACWPHSHADPHFLRAVLESRIVTNGIFLVFKSCLEKEKYLVKLQIYYELGPRQGKGAGRWVMGTQLFLSAVRLKQLRWARTMASLPGCCLGQVSDPWGATFYEGTRKPQRSLLMFFELLSSGLLGEETNCFQMGDSSLEEGGSNSNIVASEWLIVSGDTVYPTKPKKESLQSGPSQKKICCPHL